MKFSGKLCLHHRYTLLSTKQLIHLPGFLDDVEENQTEGDIAVQATLIAEVLSSDSRQGPLITSVG